MFKIKLHHTFFILVKLSFFFNFIRGFCPGIPKPPQHVITRLGTYYNTYFIKIKTLIRKYNSQETKAIKERQLHFQVEQYLNTYHFNQI